MSSMVHLANVLVLGSFCVKDILWLRVLSIAAAFFFILYFFDAELYPPIYWNALFSAVNLFQLGTSLLRRRPLSLTLREQQLREHVFPDLLPHELRDLVSIATLRQSSPGERLVYTGQDSGSIFLIVKGTVEVSAGETLLNRLGPHRFFGEMSFLSGTSSEVQVTTATDLRVLIWPRELLQSHLQQEPGTARLLRRRLGEEMIRKYRCTVTRASRPQGPVEYGRQAA